MYGTVSFAKHQRFCLVVISQLPDALHVRVHLQPSVASVEGGLGGGSRKIQVDVVVEEIEDPNIAG